MTGVCPLKTLPSPRRFLDPSRLAPELFQMNPLRRQAFSLLQAVRHHQALSQRDVAHVVGAVNAGHCFASGEKTHIDAATDITCAGRQPRGVYSSFPVGDDENDEMTARTAPYSS